jgi:hypothetical protein
LDDRASKHSLYSPDFVSTDFHLSGTLKRHLGGYMFQDAFEVQEGVSQWFHSQSPEFCTDGINILMTHCYKCMSLWGKYMEK